MRRLLQVVDLRIGPQDGVMFFIGARHPAQRKICPENALPGLYLIGAMGSKGLLLARYLADLLMRHILIGVEIPEEVSIRRYL